MFIQFSTLSHVPHFNNKTCVYIPWYGEQGKHRWKDGDGGIPKNGSSFWNVGDIQVEKKEMKLTHAIDESKKVIWLGGQQTVAPGLNPGPVFVVYLLRMIFYI